MYIRSLQLVKQVQVTISTSLAILWARISERISKSELTSGCSILETNLTIFNSTQEIGL